MFELTNEQRKCFGLIPVEKNWVRMELKPSPYDCHQTFAYLDGTVIRKMIATGDTLYTERELCEQISDDLTRLLPKTGRGKPVLLSAATLNKRMGAGMCLGYGYNSSGHYAYIDLYNQTSQKCYYQTSYEYFYSMNVFDFPQWVEDWCSQTTQEDLDDVTQFAQETRQHQKFREGDVFRFKINRRLYGYGRILLDYNLMRKKKVPFWDILMGKPLVCSVYHIATERKDVTVEELSVLKSLPSTHIMDNALFFGDFEIIGNIPISDHEDYPIMYGDSIDARYRAVILQCGKLYRKDENGTALFYDLRNGAIGFRPLFYLPILQACIAQGSNDPYWAQNNHITKADLRNPQLHDRLIQVCDQFNVDPSDLIYGRTR